MAKGIYSSGMSCWERRKKGLPQDHAGPTTIPSKETVKVKPEKVVEAKVEAKVEKKVEAKAEKKTETKVAKKTTKKTKKKSVMDKLSGK